MIEGDLVKLKPFGIEDADFLFRWYNDPEYTGPYEPFEPVTLEQLNEWLSQEKVGVFWDIIMNLDGEKVGQIVASPMDDGSYKIGFRVIPVARGRGYCTEATKTLVKHLFNSGVERIEAGVNPANIASRRVLDKAGFKATIYRERAIEVNGVWLDGIEFECRRS